MSTDVPTSVPDPKRAPDSDETSSDRSRRPGNAQDDHCGIRIGADGTWYYQGSPITRSRLVKLFSTVLRREGDGYFLVTPVERGRIDVDDAPFVAVALRREGEGASQRLVFRTNVDDEVTADAGHPIRVAPDTGDGPRPYVMVRDGLEALIARAVYYDLVELGEERVEGDTTRLGVWSGGQFFVLGETGT